MEKKVYVTPAMGYQQMESREMVLGVSGDGAGVNAGYGGVDTGGSKDPSAKMRTEEDFFSDEEDLW